LYPFRFCSVTGALSSGAATLASAAVTNDASVGGNATIAGTPLASCRVRGALCRRLVSSFHDIPRRRAIVFSARTQQSGGTPSLFPSRSLPSSTQSWICRTESRCPPTDSHSGRTLRRSWRIAPCSGCSRSGPSRSWTEVCPRRVAAAFVVESQREPRHGQAPTVPVARQVRAVCV